ncbi:PKD domain-containing protein [Shewanella khirikhana]|uniref:Chitinase A n=1 Tax=Shewanella khirikhana TaxID=1965282 RepID=A0ABM7DSU6_9GAMM|nr:PKD domain-containing protein [Shewanella khirikhana]AZQ12783.1 Chitinase A precursor [Shewanella khirikhana]
MFRIQLVWWFCILIVLQGCSGDRDNSVITPPVEPPLQPPVEQALPIADAGHPIRAKSGASVVLNGSGSHDPSGKSLTFEWQILSRPTGSQVQLTDATKPYPGLVLDRPGEYRVQLVVSNGTQSSNPAVVVITDTDTPPVADAGADIKLSGTAAITLDGSQSFDVDGDSLSYSWTLVERPAGSQASLYLDKTAFPLLQHDVAGQYIAELVVSDGTLESAPDRMIISDANTVPVAKPVAGAFMALGTAVRVSGSGSFDADGDSLTYEWHMVSRPAGSQANLLDASVAETSITPDVAGDYIVALVVKDASSASKTATVTLHAASSVNRAPIAVTGHDRLITTSQEVHLDGTASHDPDGDAISYRWSLVHKPSGSQAQLSEPFSVHPFFTPDVTGSYVAQLIVNDGTRDSLPVTVLLTDSNLPPVAHAGSDIKGGPGQTVLLDGSASTDGNGDPLSYRWSLVSQPAGSQAVINNPGSAQPTLTVDIQGHYVAQLIVNDGYADSAPDAVIITDVNLAPVADAGSDQKASKGSKVNLSGSRSTDPEGQALSYRWKLLSQPAGSAAVLSATDTIDTQFVADLSGDYIVQLVVNDGELDSVPATVIVRDFDKNTLPVAYAGPDLGVEAGQSVILDGSASFDADGDGLSYQWALLTRPSGSVALLSDIASANPTLKTDLVGDYVVQLVVSDGKGNSLPDTVLIHDVAKNVAPVADAGNDQQVNIGDLVTLSGQASYDANGDTLSYRWALISKPAQSLASLSGTNQASSQFTLDIAGSYVAQLIVSDGKLDSSPVTVAISNKPSDGIGANPVPSGHTLILSSSLGGEDQVGGLYSISEKSIADIHPLLSLKGKPGVQTTGYLGLEFNPASGKFYFMLPNEGLYAGAAVMSFDPVTKVVDVLHHVEYEIVNGDRVYGFDTRLLLHPSGKALFGLAKYGSYLDAGRVFYLNIDASSPDYLKFAWIADLGAPDAQGDTYGRSPLAHMQWNGANRIFIANYSSRFATKTNVLELTPSDAQDLSKPWVPNPFMVSTYSSSLNYLYSGPYIYVSGDTFVSALQNNGNTIFDVNTRAGGSGGYVNFECWKSLGVFRWIGNDVFSVCRGDSSHQAMLTEVSTAGGQSSDVRRFSNWAGQVAIGFAPSTTGGALYITNADENAAGLADAIRTQGTNTVFGITVKPSQVRSVGGLNFSDAPFIVGGGDRGYVFLGDPGIADVPGDSINDRYVSVISFDGGDTRYGAIITKDRLDDSVSVTSLGYKAGAYPIGKPLVHSNGKVYGGVWYAPGFSGAGTLFSYDPINAIIQYGSGNGDIRPGIALKEDDRGGLVGLGIDMSDNFRQVLYRIDPDSLAFTELSAFGTTDSAHAASELQLRNDEAWFVSSSTIHCYNMQTKAQGSSAFVSTAGHSPVRGLSFSDATNTWYVATRASATANQGAIQAVSNDCGHPVNNDVVAGLTDIPSTGLLSATNGKLYYGTENGKLMQFDSQLNQVQPVATLGAGKVIGYLTEDTNGDILGILRLGADDMLFAVPLAGGAATTKTLPRTSPADVYYPGVVELK